MPMRESHDGNHPIRIPPPRPRRGRSLLRPMGLEDSATPGLDYIEPPDDLTEDTPPTAIPGSFLITLAGEEEDLDEGSIEPDEEPTAERIVRHEASQERATQPVPARREELSREWLQVEHRAPEPSQPSADRGVFITWAAVSFLIGAGLALLLMS